MSFRRPLNFLLGEVAQGTLDAARNAPVAVRDIEIDLPVDLRIRENSEEGGELFGDVPLFLTRTEFDTPVSRLKVRWEAQAEDGL